MPDPAAGHNRKANYVILRGTMKLLQSVPTFMSVALAGLLLAGGCKSNPTQQASTSATPSQPAQTAQPTAPPPANPPQDAQSSGPAAPQPGTPTAAPAAAPAPAPAPVIPAGTRIRVRVGQTLSTKVNQAGDTFPATVEAPVEVEGQTVIPAGASATGTVTQSKGLGRFKGQALLSVSLDRVRVGGRSYPVSTGSIERVEKGKGKRSAEFIGGGAGLGALIGGLAGGGKGALIGGLAGGGAGTAGSAFTGNKDLVIPAETVLTFRLTRDVRVE
jgi:hypothetical protein